MSRRRTKVMLWGPFPTLRGVLGGGIGGYARCNAQILRSFLGREFDLIPHAVTVPRFRNPLLASLHMIPRLSLDVVSTAVALVRHRPDVLHVSSQYFRSIYREAFAVAFARALGIATLFDVRAGTFDAFATKCGRLERRLLDWIMKHAGAITVEGKRYEAFIEREWGRSSSWVPNFFLDEDLARYSAAPLVQPDPSEPFRLCFVGALALDKGVDVLLEAGWLASAQRPIRITLIGHPTPEIADVLATWRARQGPAFEVLVTGRLEMDAVLATLRDQHAFVFLSRHVGEGHSNAVNEAMAMGLPIIASKAGFLADIVTPECGVTLEDARSASIAADALLALASDWPALKAKGAASRRRVEKEFDSRSALGATARAYEELAESSR